MRYKKRNKNSVRGEHERAVGQKNRHCRLQQGLGRSPFAERKMSKINNKKIYVAHTLDQEYTSICRLLRAIQIKFPTIYRYYAKKVVIDLRKKFLFVHNVLPYNVGNRIFSVTASTLSQVIIKHLMAETRILTAENSRKNI